MSRLDERVIAVEESFVRHWSHFGLYPGASLKDEDGVLWFESPIRHLPYNAVIRTRISETANADAIIARIIDGFRGRDVPFLWVQRPSDLPENLDRLLAAHGLDLVETVTGMDLELTAWDPEDARTDARIVDIGTDPRGLTDYEELIRTYWSVPDSERHMIETLNRWWTGERSAGFRLVAYLDGVAVGKLFANTEDYPDRLAIYGVAVKPEARGRGVATAMMTHALRHAKEHAVSRCVLHSSAMAHSLYLRMGFQDRCVFKVFATAAIFGTHHH